MAGLRGMGGGLAAVAGTIGARGAYPKVDGTGTFATIPVPNDGEPHAVAVYATTDVTAAETGGIIQVRYTSGGTPGIQQIDNGGSGVGLGAHVGFPACDPGTDVTLQQTSALTAGASTVRYTVVVF
jgi:hypothetical protein